MLAALRPQPPSTLYQFEDPSDHCFLAVCPPCRKVKPFLAAELHDPKSRINSLLSALRLSPLANDASKDGDRKSDRSLSSLISNKTSGRIAAINLLVLTTAVVESKGWEEGSVKPTERSSFALSEHALGSVNFLDPLEKQQLAASARSSRLKELNSSIPVVNPVGVATASPTWTRTGFERRPTTVNNQYLDLESYDSLDSYSSPPFEQAHPQIEPDSFSLSGRGTSVSPPPPAKKRQRRNTVQASLGDAVLISFLAPEQHDVARHAGLDPLPWPSESEPSEPDMEGGSGSGGGSSSQGASRRQSQDETRDSGNTGKPSGDDNSAQAGNSAGNGQASGNGAPGDGDGDDDKSKKPPPDLAPDESVEEEKPKRKKVKNSDQEDTTNKQGDRDEGTIRQDMANKHENPDPMDIDSSTSSETAASLMNLAGGAVREHAQSYPAASLPGFPPANGGDWANTSSQAQDGSAAGFPPSPEASNKNYSNKLSSPLPSILPHGSSHDGKPTLPPLNSIDVLAELATKESPQQQQANWNGSRRTSESRTVIPAVHAHVNLAASNRPPAPPQSPGLPPPGYGAEGSPRPPIHHMSAQQRQFFINPDTSNSYFHKNSHYQSPYPPIKDASSPGNGTPYVSNYQTNRELPDLVRSSPASNHANFFAQQLPAGLGGPGRRESTSSEFQYGSDHAIPSGPTTGETMPSTGSDDTITSPRNRSSMTASAQTGSLSGGGFKCEHPGCKAPPFQTQYLLNSHANVHSSNRPHYCPVKGCPRAEGGKGFKRKNEMIRHGLVHDSPGYVCPFCPDREHKYPRPDNLQRHVRVHHMDKDKDDPLLRDVLSQRPEGGSRGRRRRLGTSS